MTKQTRSSFVIRHSSFRAGGAFTLIELLIVMAIILVLAGLILATSDYVQKKGYRSRAEVEIAAISAALENYKADHGVYPRGKSIAAPPNGSPTYAVAATGTDDLNARTDLTSSGSKYRDASRYLYEQLSGDLNLDLSPDTGSKSYMPFKESNLALIKDATGKTVGLSHIKDPFGNSYGYSSGGATTPPVGYNPTFDLWSTCGNKDPNETDQQYVARWIKNW
ncbi:MAG TPA: type II secretion system protein [Chthoniobacterales bacterium]|nr:type II secretion system protein [Chthoniobacterales bacterium]